MSTSTVSDQNLLKIEVLKKGLIEQRKKTSDLEKEVIQLKEHYHKEMVRCKELENMVIKEIRVADSIRNDYVADASKIKDEEIEQTKRKETVYERQPVI